MAEDKKEGGKDMTNEMVFLLMGLFLLSVLISRLLAYWHSGKSEFIRALWASIALFFLTYGLPLLKVLSVLVSVGAAVGIVHVWRRLNALSAEEEKIYGSVDVDLDESVEPTLKNEKWERIVSLVNTPNPSDWRLAVIEADVMLEDALRKAGYHGDSLGEMLKAVDKSDLTSIDDAWQAHKTRNDIAHRGGEFLFNEREAKQAVALFEKVFRELRII